MDSCHHGAQRFDCELFKEDALCTEVETMRKAADKAHSDVKEAVPSALAQTPDAIHSR